MIELKDSNITDILPVVFKNDPSVKALGYALRQATRRLVEWCAQISVYALIDAATDDVLDLLALELNTQYYDDTLDIDTKRKLIKGTLGWYTHTGTPTAVKELLTAIYGGGQLEEWFEYGGEPGTFRLYIDISYSDAEHPVTDDIDKVQEQIDTVKRLSAHMESLSYMVRRGIEIGKKVEGFTCEPPRCGMILCGTYPYIATVGWSDGTTIQNGAKVDGYDVTPPLCGTVPDEATAGYSSDVTIAASGEAAGFEADATLCGEAECGTTPEESTAGISIASSLDEGGEAEGYEVVSSVCGTSACGTLP